MLYLQRILFTLGEDLETVVMVADILLVDGQHWQQHIKQVTCVENHFNEKTGLLPSLTWSTHKRSKFKSNIEK